MAARFEQKLGVLQEAPKPEARHAGLPGTQQFARSTEREILFRDAKPIVRRGHGVEPATPVFADRAAGDEETMRRAAAASHASSKLMQLREPEALRVEDDHHRRRRNVDANLDHGRRDEDVERAIFEGAHHTIALL